MDLTNRVLIVGAALLWVFVILIVILLAWGAPDESIDRLGRLAGYMDDHNDTPAKLLITFGGLILALMAAIVVIFELSPPESGDLKVQKVGSGDVHIGTDEIALRLESELPWLPQVNQVQASVVARGQKAEVNLDLHVTPEADLAATTDETCRRARQILEEHIGVALARPPRAQIHYRELLVARPQAPASRQSPPAGSAGQTNIDHPADPGSTGPASPEGQTAAAHPAHETQETSPEDRPTGA